MTRTQLDVDFFASSVINDPYPVYERIRSVGRVVWNGTFGGWMITGFDDCTAILTDTGERFGMLNGDRDLIFWFDAPNMIEVDGAEHERLRRYLAPLFTRQAVAKWERRVRDVVDELLVPLAKADYNFDLIADFTMIPTVIVAEMLGVPKDRYQDFRRWSHDIVSNLSYGHEDLSTREVMRKAGDEVNSYLAREIEGHRHQERDDLISAMLTMQDMSDPEIRSAAVLVLLAGYDTTAKLMANCLVVLEQHPAQRRLVVQNPSLVPAAIEEVLRWTGVTQASLRRVAHDTVLADTELRAGDAVAVMHAAANRDPVRWAHPERFDVRRELKSHHGFGFGPHLCLGAPLARLETKIALERLLAMAPEYRLRDIDYGTTFFARGPERGSIEAMTISSRR